MMHLDEPQDTGTKVLVGAFVAMSVFLIWFLHRQTTQSQKDLIHSEGTQLRQNLHFRLNGGMDFVGLLSNRLANQDLDKELFETSASLYVEDHAEIKQILWLDSGLDIVERTASEEFSEYRQLGNHSLQAAGKAIEMEKHVYTQPYMSHLGEPVFELWFPIRFKGGTVGAIGSVYSCKTLLKRICPDNFLDRYQVDLIDSHGAILAQMSSDSQALGARISFPIAEPRMDLIIISRSQPTFTTTTVILATLCLCLAVGMIFVLVNQRREIAERRWAEDALRRSEQRIRLLVDNIDVGITLTDKNHKIIAANAAMGRIFRKDPDEFLGKLILQDADHWHANQPDNPGEEAAELETHGTREDGSPFVALKKVFPLRKSNGEINGFIELIQDITERKRAEEERLNLERQVQHAQKLESLGVLAGGIAHDFNNLLMGVLGNADLAQLSIEENSPAMENLRDIEKAAHRAAELCKQMLAYSGKGRFVIRPLDLSALVEDMAHILEVSISKNVRLKCNFQENLPAIKGDVTQIRQVIMNLITNASDAIGKQSGLISIKTGVDHFTKVYLNESYMDTDLPAGDYVFCEVADTGCGMNAETMEKLFDPFFTTKFTGRGLGLAAVLGIIRGHMGCIKVYSEIGKGSLFRVLFPVHNQASESEAFVSTTGQAQWRGKGTVLVIDDEQTVRELSRTMLTHIGFDVCVAEDGCKGLEIFKRHRHEIVLVLLDLTMPHLDGAETYKGLRRIDDKVPVIMSSGYSEFEVTQRFRGQGLTGFIQKPYQLETLRAKLQEALPELDR